MPGRGAKLSRWAALAVGLVVVFAAPELLAYNDYWLSVIIIAAVSILTVAGVRLVLLVDQISLGQVAFSLIGAYGSALLMMKAHVPFVLAVPLCGAHGRRGGRDPRVSFPQGEGHLLLDPDPAHGRDLPPGGVLLAELHGRIVRARGRPQAHARDAAARWHIDFAYISNYYYVVLGVIVVSMAVLYLLERSRVSFRWQAIRDSEELARSVGINVMRYKAATFVIACFFAGIAGAVYAHFQRNLSADTTSRFGVWMSLYLLVYMVVGGQELLGAASWARSCSPWLPR